MTIEASLIMRELLLRKKVRTLVVAAPPSVLEQWQAELEERFGLLFVLLDRAYLTRMRRERGFGVNPWRTHSRFLVSHHARWIDPSQRNGPLRAYGADGEQRTLAVLDQALTLAGQQMPGQVRQQRLLSTAAADVASLQPLLVPRAEQAAAVASAQLRLRGEQEATELRTTIEQQAKRVREQLDHSTTEYVQLTFGFTSEEKRQFDLDQRAWEQRLALFERELSSEPDRVRAFYEVRVTRVEPVGLIYLWPASN